MAADKKRLHEIFAGLDTERRGALLEFAEFLASRSRPPAPGEIPAPAPIQRPAGETVVAAIRRLSQSYSMVDKAGVLHQASALMTEHIMRGRAADEVIDELERVFERQYRSMADGRGD